MKTQSRFTVPTAADNAAREAQAQAVEREIRTARAAASRAHYAAMCELPGYREHMAAKARERYRALKDSPREIAKRDTARRDPVKREAARARSSAYYAKRRQDPNFRAYCRARTAEYRARLAAKP